MTKVSLYFAATVLAEINFEIPLKKDIWTLGLIGWVVGDWTSFKRIWDFELDMIVTWT